MILVEVVYALANDQFLVELEVAESASAMDAIQQSGVFERFPELRKHDLEIGIFSRPVKPETELAEGDRLVDYGQPQKRGNRSGRG